MTKILIVEDESSFSEAISFLLGKEGFETDVAENGRTALELFKASAYDLVLLDLMIPEVSGIEVCRAIRTTSMVPIIMLTAKERELKLYFDAGLQKVPMPTLALQFNPLEISVWM